jgi:hypothetical protein
MVIPGPENNKLLKKAQGTPGIVSLKKGAEIERDLVAAEASGVPIAR